MAENANSPKKPECPKRLRRAADFRYFAIRPLIRFRTAQLAGKKVFVLSLDPNVPEVSTLDDFAVLRAKQLGVSDRSLWRWYMRFAARGYEGLLDPPRRDRGRSHFFDRHTFARAFVLGKAADGLRAAAIHRELLAAWPQLGETSKPPAYSTVRQYLASLRIPEAR